MRIIPVCDDKSNIIDYKKESLGNLGKCASLTPTPQPSLSPTPLSPSTSQTPDQSSLINQTREAISNFAGAPKPPEPKEIVSIKVNNEDLVLDGSSALSIKLPGTEGRPQTFEIPVVFTYSDGSIKATVLKFIYNPPQEQVGEPEIVDWCSKKECDTAIGKLVCYKKWSNDKEEISEATEETCEQKPYIIDYCARKDCDTALGKLVCIEEYSDGTEKVGSPTDEACGSPTSQQTVSDCRDNPVTPYPGYKWTADCNQSCNTNADCSRGANNQEGWCYGFESGPRCLKLEQE